MKFTLDPKKSQLSWIEVLQEQIGSLQFGVVQIVVHDSRVVQIERTEKFRFDKGAAHGGSGAMGGTIGS